MGIVGKMMRKKDYCTNLKILKSHLEDYEHFLHEKAHSDKFIEFGYTAPSFALTKDFETDELIFIDVLYNQKEVSDKHLIEISLAPKKPSITDRESALDAWARVQERRLL